MQATFGGMSKQPVWLLSRTDRIGDLVLTLPMARFIQRHLPDVEVRFLVSYYTAPILAAHETPITGVIWEEQPDLGDVSAIFHVFPRPAIAWAAFRARVPHRIGTSRRWYHLALCNHRPTLSRKGRFQHEAYLNLQLLAPLLPAPLKEAVQGLTWQELLSYRARLQPSALLPPSLGARLSQTAFRIGLHLGGLGGAPRWPLSSWTTLLAMLTRRFPEVHFLFTGTSAEKSLIDQVTKDLPAASFTDTSGQLTLPELLALLARLDLFIGGSTGPLHLAAALDRPTVSLFPATAAMGPWRWQPLSPHSRVLAADKVCTRCTAPRRSCLCLARILPLQVVEAATALLQRPELH